MKAMILAAGLGTRLRPLTDDRPKALVKIAGRTLLEITLARLRESGICSVIINVHHYADMVIDYLHANDNFGMDVAISREDILLDTGGGLKKASQFFLAHSDGPFLLHNVDVISTIDFAAMLRSHTQQRALASLAVQDRQTSRYLLFDPQLQLCGRRLEKTGKTELVRQSPATQPLAFSGIHVISPRIFELMTEQGVFSIIDAYLRLAGEDQKILAFRADEYAWRDLGTPQSVREAALDLSQN